jgi:hypothetical protein
MMLHHGFISCNVLLVITLSAIDHISDPSMSGDSMAIDSRSFNNQEGSRK